MSQGRNEVVAALQQRLAAAPDQVSLARLASELGHAIARDHLDGAAAGDLARRLARWGRDASEGDRHYMRALEDVLGAVSAALLDDEERASIEHTVASKRDWARVLELLAEAPRGPNELAKALGAAKNNGRITKLLGELESLGLVQSAPSANGKSRPRRLTARGHRIARSLRARPSAASEPAEPDDPGSLLDAAAPQAVRERDRDRAPDLVRRNG